VTVLHHGVPYEVTTLRGEGAYTDGRHPDEVVFVGSIEQDLERRDFTVNALAYDPLDDRFVDPWGGLADLEQKVLRAVGDPKTRFREDGLRVLRAARFAATLEFELETDTEAAVPEALDVFARVSRERVRDEWLKAMKGRLPSRALDVMRRTGILAVTCPLLLDQVGCEQNRWHAYDVWRHSLECLDASRADPIARLAALLHDLGKPKTRERSDKTGDYTFYNHETVGADMADAWLRDYRFSNQERETIVHLVRHHLICYSPEWSDAAVRRFLKRVGRDHIEALLELGRADALGKGRPVEGELLALSELKNRVDKIIEAGLALTTRDLAIKGQDVMARLSIPPGPRIGAVLDQLLERVLDDPALNERDTLLRLVDEMGRTS